MSITLICSFIGTDEFIIPNDAIELVEYKSFKPEVIIYLKNNRLVNISISESGGKPTKEEKSRAEDSIRDAYQKIKRVLTHQYSAEVNIDILFTEYVFACTYIDNDE